jgi:hypothetical protein
MKDAEMTRKKGKIGNEKLDLKDLEVGKVKAGVEAEGHPKGGISDTVHGKQWKR